MEDMKDNCLILGLLKTYQDPEPRLADFAIHCAGKNGEEIVWCHKIILVLRSEYFDGLLRTEPEAKSISLPDYSFEVVKTVVKSAIKLFRMSCNASLKQFLLKFSLILVILIEIMVTKDS